MRNICVVSAATRFNDRLVKIATLIQPAALLMIRLFWGWRLYVAGLGHLTHVQDTYENFVKWGVPMAKFNVYVSGVTELVGGLLLLAGLFTRVTSMVVFFNFCVALWATSRAEVAGIFTGPERWDHLRSFIDDNAFPFWTVALVLLAFGPGKFAVDHLLGKCCGGGKCDPKALEPQKG
jgi:putative oxidoreductase